MSNRSFRRIAAVLTAIAGITIAAPASAALPVHYSTIEAAKTYAGPPRQSPPGANDWACVPTAAHPRPVVLVHATYVNMAFNWNALSPLLKNEGYCVYALDYGLTKDSFGGRLNGLGPIQRSAAELAAFIDRVRAATGAAKVDLVGHSQGGLLARYYLGVLGGASNVGVSVGLGPPTHGTTIAGLVPIGYALAALSPLIALHIRDLEVSTNAGNQQRATSTFIKALNKTPETQPGVRYMVISTIYDQMITPWMRQRLRSPDAINVVLQRQCPIDFVEHVALPFDSIALRNVLNALDPSNAKRPQCKLITPLVGG